MTEVKDNQSNKKLFGIILLTAAGLLLLSVSLFAQNSRIIHEKSFDVSEGELLYVKTDRGDVKVQPWNENRVHVEVRGSREIADRMEFTFEKINGRVEIIAEKEGGWNNWWGNWGGGNLYFEIKIPARFDVEVRTAGGDVALEAITGMIDLKTSGGDVDVRDVEGNVNVGTSGGDITVLSNSGDLKASTSGGDIKMRAATGRIDASTSGGDIDLTYEGENEGIDLSTSGGDINVYVPSDIKADIYLSTSGGDVECSLDNMSNVETNKRRTKYEGRANGGGNKLYARTSGGDVEVRSRR